MDPWGKLEWHQRQPDDARCLFSVKRMSWSWFSAELVRVRPTELEFRVKGNAAYLALHDSVRSDGETTIDGRSCSTLTDLRDKLTFVPIGSSLGGWNRFEGRTSSVFAVHLTSTRSDQQVNDISSVPPALYCRGSHPLVAPWLRWSFGQPSSPQPFFISRKVFGAPIRAKHVFEIGNT